jgi:hypothetical protein
MCRGRSTLEKFYFLKQPSPAKAVMIRTDDNPALDKHSSGSCPSRFQYIGSTGLTIVSSITGRRYHFDHPGARLEVDARDGSWLTFVPNLKAA